MNDDWFNEDYMIEEENEEEYIDVEQYLCNFDKEDLIKLVNKLNITIDNFKELSEDDLIDKIIEFEDDDLIINTCVALFDYSYDDFIIDNSWKHSNYEEKDISDWSIDDHIAAWYDHIMEK